MEIWDMMWIYAVVLLLVSEAWSLNPVVRNSTFHQGSDVHLTCSNKTWNETLFVVWHIELQNRNVCMIGIQSGTGTDNTCRDGKSLRNTSSTQSYLYIPNISARDVGVYKCDTSYKGGIDSYAIHVSLIVPPSISAWLEDNGDSKVAVCKAEKGKPAANISWSHLGELSSEVSVDSGGFFTVESRLEFPEETDTENLTCVIRHPYWKEERIYSPKPQEGLHFALGYGLVWLWVPTGVVIVVLLAAFAFLARKKLATLRLCQKSKSLPSKQPQMEDVEEVEPYASYVQRVNSIYNSSADLFT